jgi:uncharacterized membrane protein
MTLANFRKALVAVAGAIVIIADGFGIDVDQDTLDAVVAAVVALAVYVVPNG